LSVINPEIGSPIVNTITTNFFVTEMKYQYLAYLIFNTVK